MNVMLRKYLQLLSPLEELNSLSHKAFGDLIQCRKGCAMCCHGLFDIGILDALLLHDAWRKSEKKLRLEIESASENLLASIERIAPEWVYPHFLHEKSDDEVDAILENIGMAACPVLGSDLACRLYEARPFYCRVHGLKLRDSEGNADIDTDCEYNFPTIPDRDTWPAFAFSTLFYNEGALVEKNKLDPDERFLIPAVTTSRFRKWFESRTHGRP